MFDLEYQTVELECPGCRYPIQVLLRQAAAEEVIICPGCRHEIQLQDEGGSVSHATPDISTALDELERAFRKLGR